MRKEFLLFLSIFYFGFNLSAFSQLYAKYNVKHILDGKLLTNDICVLSVGKSASFFYSQGKLDENDELELIIKKSMADGAPLKLNSNALRMGLCNFSIIKDYAKRRAIYVQNVARQNFGFVRDSLSTKRWKILPEKKVINNLKCQKAQMKRDTTTITAWFCSDIPTPEGPLYYYGLPGLIVKVNTTAGWSAVLISHNKSKIAKLELPKFTLVTERQLSKAIENSKGRMMDGRISLPSGSGASKGN